MLPTSGYFRDILCPFLKSGLCERTHCHYKHENLYKPKPSTSKPIPSYVPTPVARLKSTNNYHNIVNNGMKCEKTTKSATNIPEYKPTPISQLKRQQIGNYSYNSNDGNGVNNGTSDDNSIDNSDYSFKDKKTFINEFLTKKSNERHKKLTETKNEDKSKTKKDIKNKKELNSLSKDKKSGNNSQKSKVNNELDNNSSEESISSQSSPKKRKSFDELIASNEEVYDIVCKKVRVAHQSSSVSPKKLEKKAIRPTPSQVMQQRFASQTSKKEDKDLSQKSTKCRTAHKLNNDSVHNESCNSVLGKQRIAHKPSVLKRPTIMGNIGNKVPLKLRQLYLNKLIDEFLLFCEEEEAFRRGLESEKSVYDRSKTSNIYKNIAVHEVKKIRSEATERLNGSPTKQNMSPEKIKKLGNQVVSHEAILNGKISGTFSIEKRQKALKTEELTDVELYKMLFKYVMNESQLKDYGYPRTDPANRGSALLPKLELSKMRNNYESRVRNCSRCQKIYTVDDYEMPVRKEVCIYHFGRLWNERFNRSIERKYSCCKNDVGSGGCCSNPSHIFDGFDRPDYRTNYVRTLPKKPPPQSGYYGIYGLDCEMCYTTHGLELTRVTVVNVQQQTIYETLVKPSHPILDYNSKFSGIKDGDLNKVTTTISDVQNRLLSLFNDKTILIGHSLESDLKALKLIHDTVVDTAQVFPHKRGLPYKRALRTLTAEFLQKIIQDDVDGHDSQEDATAALKLMLWKVREDLKKFKR